LFLNLLIKGLIVDSRRNALKSAHLLWIIIMKSKSLEWFGVVTAIMYSMMVALNIGVEFAGFHCLFQHYRLAIGPILESTGEFSFSSFSMQQLELLAW